ISFLAAVVLALLPSVAQAAGDPQLAALQVALARHGFYAGPIDGSDGPAPARRRWPRSGSSRATRSEAATSRSERAAGTSPSSSSSSPGTASPPATST